MSVHGQVSDGWKAEMVFLLKAPLDPTMHGSKGWEACDVNLKKERVAHGQLVVYQVLLF